MFSLWKRAIESNKALLLDEINLGPDALLEKVEEFEGISQATEHSYPALILSNEDGGARSAVADSEDDMEDSYSCHDLPTEPEDDDYDKDYYDDDDDDYDDDSYVVESSAPPGSLPVDLITKKYRPLGDK